MKREGENIRNQSSPEKLGHLLQKIMKVLHVRGRKTLMEEELTLPQYYVLSLLSNKGFWKMSDLKEQLFILKRNWFVKFRRFPVPYLGTF